VEGIGNMAKWYRLFTALGIECFCVFDTDSNKTGQDAEDLLAKRKDIMTALGHDGDRAKVENLSTDPIAVEDGYATLNPNFEGAAAALFGDRLADLYEEAAQLVGDSKSLRARYAAQHLADEDFTGDAAATLDALVQAIGGKPPEQADGGGADDPVGEPPDTDHSGDPEAVEASSSAAEDEPPF
jgi:putative ATP-dependent endonuclease of OLD family